MGLLEWPWFWREERARNIYGGQSSLHFVRRLMSVYFIAHAAAVDKCPGEFRALCVMYTQHLMVLLGWPWFWRERARDIGRFSPPW